MATLLFLLRHALKLSAAPFRWLLELGVHDPHAPAKLLISLTTLAAFMMAALVASGDGNCCCYGNFGHVAQVKSEAKAALDM